MLRFTFAAIVLASSSLVTAEPSPCLPSLAEGRISSFGTVECKGFIYVYGGHAGEAHSYSKETNLGTFPRIAVGGGKWEELPGGPRLQGLNLATVGGKVYRVGGMEARNQAGEKQVALVSGVWPSSTRMPTSGRPEWLYRTVDRPTMSLASAPSSWSWADGRCRRGAKNPSGPIRLFYWILHLQPRSGRPFLSPSSGEPFSPRLWVLRFMSSAG